MKPRHHERELRAQLARLQDAQLRDRLDALSDPLARLRRRLAAAAPSPAVVSAASGARLGRDLARW